MVRGALGKNLRRTVSRSLGRFLAILGIIALGAGFLVGLKGTRTAMLATEQAFLDEAQMFDFRVLSTYGYDAEAVEALRQIPGIGQAEGGVSFDVLLHTSLSEDDKAYKLLSLPEQLNLPTLRAGRMPQGEGECLADSNAFSEADIGSTLYLSENNENDTLGRLKTRELTIVGLGGSPLYMNFERGGTSLGSGSLAGFLYLPQEAFQMDGAFTEVYLRMERSYPVYSQTYLDALDTLSGSVEDAAKVQAQRRYAGLLADAEEQLEKGQAEYDRQSSQAREQLADAEQTLEQGRQELESGRQTLLDAETRLLDSQEKVDRGWQQVRAGQAELERQRTQAETAFAQAGAELEQSLRTLREQDAQIADGLKQVADGLVQLEAGLSQAQSGKEQLEKVLSALRLVEKAGQLAQEGLDKALAQDPENELLLQAKAQLDSAMDELSARKGQYESQYQELLSTIASLEAKQQELQQTQQELEQGQASIAQGYTQLADGMAELERRRSEAQAQMAQAQQTIDNTIDQLVLAQKQILAGSAEVSEGKENLAQAEQELNQGQSDYDKARQEAESGLAQGAKALADAKAQVQAMKDTPPQVYALDRNTNVGYVCFESDSNIVAGVSRVFPVFYFLVAALRCVTTITKMVSEERTQIGVLKALGYSDGAITAKYLAYSGLASLAGCTVGVALGTTLFPSIIWMGYTIMYNFAQRVRLVIDWPLCLGVTGAYLAGILGVSWLCCRRELTECAASLIRPEAPKAGKRLLLERLSFWKHLSFLKKVTARNIFRYRKRLYMTLLGVGGCTALLVTGFGIKDSIVNVVDDQYNKIALYDIAVTYTQEPDAQEQAQLQKTAGDGSQVLLLHTQSGELHTGRGVKTVNILAPDGDLEGFWNLHQGKTPLAMPGQGEALVSRAAAEDLKLSVGDLITVQTGDMRQISLKISGIFENKIYHYVILSQQTLAQATGAQPEKRTAYVTLEPGADSHAVGAALSRLDHVAQTSVNDDMRSRVGSMFKSLDYIVALVAVCAAALAFIVLYNLTNINISERIRELATLKVLGFTQRETASYVFWEDLILAAMGAVLGLALGKGLHAFVMSQIRVDMVSFDVRVSLGSYLLSLGLTMLFAVGVDLLLSRKIERIDMADALKSVE